MHRDIKPDDFEGKTIERMDLRAENIIRFRFTDGTVLALEVEGDVMVACDDCTDAEPVDVPRPPAEVVAGIDDADWDEPMARRYMGGQKCDMKTGPCACGAWHHPSRVWETLEEACTP